MRKLSLILVFSALCHAQDVHVHVSPSNDPSSNSATEFATVQRAMGHAPQPGPGGRLYVHIAPGTYSERVMVTANRPRTTFLGDPSGPSRVIITAAQNAKSAGGTFFSETVDVEAPEFNADGITFANAAGATGQLSPSLCVPTKPSSSIAVSSAFRTLSLQTSAVSTTPRVTLLVEWISSSEMQPLFSTTSRFTSRFPDTLLRNRVRGLSRVLDMSSPIPQ